MTIIFFTHPVFFESQSMPRFTRLLSDSMQKRGHTVEVWQPHPIFSRLNIPSFHKKWLGYIDQFIMFPISVRKRLGAYTKDTLFVVTDNALGPWVPLIADRPHIIHCHDFLAQNSALNKIPENQTKWSGKLYQSFIRRGYSKGNNFISVSEKTRQDLHQFLPSSPAYSGVVHNGLNQSVKSYTTHEARTLFGEEISLDLTDGYLLHVGGNQWYKNRSGVIAIYNALRTNTTYILPLILIGEKPDASLIKEHNLSPFKADIHWLSDIKDASVQVAYAGASVFLFPSLAEGFGWPIAEAMACGCPVVTTNEAPMTEVAGNAGFLIARQPDTKSRGDEWAIKAATVVNEIFTFSPEKRKEVVEAGFFNVQRFNMNTYIDRMEIIYKNVVTNSH